MGAYLNKPNVEKHTEVGEGNGLIFGSCTMQGWRATQEDAHNCIPGLTDDWSMFAVYDGHGGSEVSKYTADHLPDFVKEKEFWKSDEFISILQKIFVDFDDLLRSEPVMKELKKLCEAGKAKPEESDDSSDEADRIQTIEESRLPLEELIAKYGVSVLSNRPLLTKKLVECANESMESEDIDSDSKKKKRQCKSPAQKEKSKRLKTDEGAESEESPIEQGGDADVGNVEPAKEEKEEVKEGEEKEEEKEDALPSSLQKELEKGDVAEASDDEDESDSSFNEELADEEEEDDDDEDEEEDYETVCFPGGGDVPGDDSGTTACVCFISKNKIVVANAGDSRAVISRDGKAIDLSIDHKPEDTIEKNRIEKAGGFVNEDGRVNGGLNLSRALGDHSYKKNGELSLAEQMISAMPDVRVEELTPEDDFVVVACDGIWNSLESQQVVDFVREGFSNNKTCKEISEDLCDTCLADSTAGDGTGCDNMTVIIIKISK